MGNLYRFSSRTHRRLTPRLRSGQASRLAQAIRSLQLSALFLVVYGGCNWITAQRADVATWVFAWERHIPFWPAMILPYLSIDAFFIAAPFFCGDRDELRVFTRRVTASVLTAGACFLSMPLRFVFERPAPEGWLGVLFGGFTALDQPFNLFPSLHVALAVILADTYRRHTRGALRVAVTAWFVLIALSTIFTYQHHIVDVLGGLALSTLVFYFVRDELGTTQSFARGTNPRIAFYYLTGTATFLVLAIVFWPAGGLFLWPAVSLAIVSAAYAGAGPWAFAKLDGRLPPATWLMLWPYLIGQRASLAWYGRQCRAYDAVTPNVWIGRVLTEQEARHAVDAGVVAVVDLTPDFNEPAIFTRLPYLNVPTVDLTAPDQASLQRAVRFVTTHAQRGIVYVHCKIGYSRSAAVVATYLMASGHARTVDEALLMIRRARPQAVIRPEIVACLQRASETLLADRTRRQGFGRFAALPAVASFVLATVARLFCGSAKRMSEVDARPRVYYANHTSHLDFVVIWGSLPRHVRMRTLPVAGRDYWEKTPVRRCIAHGFLNALLVDRARADADRESTVRVAERSIERLAHALDSGASLIVFPEGTRGCGDDVQPFKSGLYHLARARPDVELVPVFLENMHRILPKGEFIPVPLRGRASFGAPIRLRQGETKTAFLARARHALIDVSCPCTLPSIVSSHPSLRASSSR
jgi:1-acyl-sn-glycerol-3-phosphate acyltransferase/predicted protein tyrosine phosphatase/membrane-associated phospholipid phosphatase